MSNKKSRNIKTRTKRAVQSTIASQRIAVNDKATHSRGRLNYKKLISSIIILFLIIFLISFGISKIFKKDNNQTQPQ